MSKKKPHDDALNCEGRFGQLRARAYTIAQETLLEEQDPLWCVVNMKDLRGFVQRMANPNGHDEGLTEDVLVDVLSVYDVKDPYFRSQHDTLRGDPLVGDDGNVYVSLAPFVFEAVRETLIETQNQVREYRDFLDGIHGEVSEETRAQLNQLEESLWFMTGFEFPLRNRKGRAVAREALDEILTRDRSITAVSVNPAILDSYAALYVEDEMVQDNLRLFHRGAKNLHRELDIDMEVVSVPSEDGKDTATLAGYGLWGEFGYGPNVNRTQVGDAPYRIELWKAPHGRMRSIGTSEAESVLGMSFFLKSPKTMVLTQIQDIRGADVPESTTDGLCAFTIAERVARGMGLERIEAYSHHTNPVRQLYPHDAEVARVLRMNFDTAAKQLGWNCHCSTARTAENGKHVFFYRDL